MDDYQARLNAKLAPEGLKQTLVRAGCFLSAYELIKLHVIDGVRSEYWRDLRDAKNVYDEARYQQEVLALDPASKFRASAAWLMQAGALTVEQAALLGAVRDHRNEIAHELPRMIIDPDVEVRTELLLSAAGCLRSIGIFWGRETVAINPQWDGQEVADDDIWSGPSLMMSMLLEIAGLGPDDLAARPA